MQNVNTAIRRRIPVGTAAAGGLLAFVAGAVIALGAPAVIAGNSISHSSSVIVSVRSAGAEQVNHSRSEAGLDVSRSTGAERVAHNRSEEGLTAP
jgi:hypothetical protein